MSTVESPASARTPQRERGRQRVADLLEAASAVFAEKGYAAATMTEIAARAQAPIGSLYQFFPNKDVLGDALMRRFGERAVQALSAIEANAARLPAAALADALLKIFVDLRQERATARSLSDASPHMADARGSEFRRGVLAGIGRILKLRAPKFAADRVAAMSMLVLLQMKAGIAALDLQNDARKAAAIRRELSSMLALYLTENLDAAAPGTSPRKATRPKPRIRAASQNVK